MPEDYLLAIPVFNEERYVTRVIEAAKRYCRDIQRDAISVITHLDNRGYGKSLADAFAFAQRHGCTWLITMDCDEQHEPACIPKFVAAAARDDAAVAIRFSGRAFKVPTMRVR